MDIRAASALMEKMGVSTIRQLRACGAAELRDQWYAVKEEFGELGWGPHADGIVIDESVLDPTASALWDADILIGSTGNDIGWEDGDPRRRGAIRVGKTACATEESRFTSTILTGSCPEMTPGPSTVPSCGMNSAPCPAAGAP